MIPRKEEDGNNKRSEGVDGPSDDSAIRQNGIEDIARDNNGVAVVFGRDHRQPSQSTELVVGIPCLRLVIEESTSHSELKIGRVQDADHVSIVEPFCDTSKKVIGL
jgi:hypothetical protein